MSFTFPAVFIGFGNQIITFSLIFYNHIFTFMFISIFDKTYSAVTKLNIKSAQVVNLILYWTILLTITR